MQLLDLKQITKENNKQVAEKKEQIRKLNEEESIITNKLNSIKLKFDTIKQSIQDDLDIFEKQIKERKGQLLKEISSLEERKKEALKPIYDIKRESEKRLEAIILRENNLKTDEETNKSIREDLLDKIDILADRKNEIEEKHTKANKRERNIAKVEEQLKESTNRLNLKWIEFHKILSEKTTEIERREKMVEAQKSANENYKKSLDDLALRQDEQRRSIKDGYKALEQAKIHLNIL